jgi:hypothetical protein
MMLCQVCSQQRSSPDRGVIVEGARILVNHFIDQRINNALDCSWTSATRTGGQAGREVIWSLLMKKCNPLINHLTTHAQPRGDLRDRFSTMKPQQSLDAS